VTDDGGYALHSWVDESMHVDGDNGLYILAAVVCAADGCALIRDGLRELLDEGQRKLHWSTESPERRERIIGVVAEVDMAAVVVIGAPLAKKKQERARAVCMETLKLIRAIRGKKLVPTEMRIDVGRPSAEPMLWVPDIVAGAAGADRVHGNPQYLDLIRSTVTQLDIPLR